ncbi:MAG: hypothetical protein BWZ11_00881 [Bacteroidetes bacterium ADurb.BinA395]|nr:MAG: hypothetical protein BWZ11_00881 [Bacteroidetes bacterium ADurb.BinA395]
MNPLLKPDFFKKEKNKIFLKRGIKFFVVLIFYNNLQYKVIFVTKVVFCNVLSFL